jgi:Protein of unknown function (DUF2911)
MYAALLITVGLMAQDSGAFVVTLGRDTVAMERYARTGARLEGQMLTRNGPAVIRRQYVVTLGPDGSVLRFEGTQRQGNDTTPPLMITATFLRDSAIVELKRGDSTRTLRLATPAPAVPYFNNSYALYELAARRAGSGGQPSPVSLIPMGGGQVIAATATRQGADSVMLLIPPQPGPYRLRVDAAGRVLGGSGAGTTQQVSVTRAATAQVATLVTAPTARPLGTLSPADSVQATVGGAAVKIKYGRPQARGRVIFGNVVPWNQVWRTGANFATNLTTSGAIVIGGAPIPAGSYTLWTLPSATGWKLIVNKQTKAPCTDAVQCASPQRAALWGTGYAADSDFVRVDAQVETLAQPIEQFTIAIDPQGDAAVLRMEWDRTRVTVPVAKKP